MGRYTPCVPVLHFSQWRHQSCSTLLPIYCDNNCTDTRGAFTPSVLPLSCCHGIDVCATHVWWVRRFPETYSVLEWTYHHARFNWLFSGASMLMCAHTFAILLGSCAVHTLVWTEQISSQSYLVLSLCADKHRWFFVSSISCAINV